MAVFNCPRLLTGCDALVDAASNMGPSGGGGHNGGSEKIAEMLAKKRAKKAAKDPKSTKTKEEAEVIKPSVANASAAPNTVEEFEEGGIFSARKDDRDFGEREY